MERKKINYEYLIKQIDNVLSLADGGYIDSDKAISIIMTISWNNERACELAEKEIAKRELDRQQT